jgi:hypothetical protein
MEDRMRRGEKVKRKEKDDGVEYLKAVREEQIESVLSRVGPRAGLMASFASNSLPYSFSLSSPYLLLLSLLLEEEHTCGSSQYPGE